MPEGDTLHTLARALAPLLAGRRLDSVEIRDRRRQARLSSVGVRSVEALGKHLLLGLEDDRVLRVHLGLYGSWHRYREGETWRKPPRQARLLLRLGEEIHVCFNAREVELLGPSAAGRGDLRRRLGPDLTAGEALDALAGRARALQPAEAPVAEVLLDQRVAAGIGNVIKSETLFLARLDPVTPLSALSDARLREVYAIAARLLQANVGGGGRDTRGIGDGRGHLWVYGRAGRPCLECGTKIRSARTGRQLRTTYWCPHCQAPAPARR